VCTAIENDVSVAREAPGFLSLWNDWCDSVTANAEVLNKKPVRMVGMVVQRLIETSLDEALPGNDQRGASLNANGKALQVFASVVANSRICIGIACHEECLSARVFSDLGESPGGSDSNRGRFVGSESQLEGLKDRG